MISLRIVLLLAGILVLGLLLFALPVSSARAFCGFYVAKADGDLFNKASKVVIARQDARTVITMVNDYQGAPDDFALVVPVPTVLDREQIHVTETEIVDHLDAYTAPRLVEYHDPDPCRPLYRLNDSVQALAAAPAEAAWRAEAKALGVTVEAQYSVGEYDILILSAEESGSLRTWLVGNGYKLPKAVVPVLEDYIAMGMKFFVARIDLTKVTTKDRRGYSYLRPLQIAFESEGFMLPIRLGMVNADGPQDLIIMTLTQRGRIELANYPTARIPSGMDIPIYVREDFGEFYKAMFTRQVALHDRRAGFLEYAWDMNWCDPCAADPLSVAQLQELGVHWLENGDRQGGTQGGAIAPPGPGGALDVFVTRLHLRYDAEHFPDDLMLTETGERENYQGRYVLRHPYSGPAQCREAEHYRATLPARHDREARQLASLTGWPLDEIRARMAAAGAGVSPVHDPHDPWWRRVWSDR